ncbi:flagellar hook-associated protein FlgK [Sphingomonas koreensis]|nr:flagellar hook-associated protein FlgK [Sphingomonas koreensis]
MSDILNIGASGIRAYQSAISTVSENIANSGVDGYSKRTTNLSEVAASSSTITRREVNAASGVVASGVSRASDPLKEADVRSAGADLARSDSAVQWLDQIQTALTGNNLSDRLGSFFTSATAVAADPSANAPRTTMLSAADSVAGAFTATGAALDQVAGALDATAQNAATTFNDLATALAKTNDAIGRNVPGTNGTAQLLDQRDQLLEQMSAIADVSVTTDDAGRATVKLGGTAGPTIVSGNSSGSLTYARGTDGAVSYAVHFGGAITTAQISGGALAGVADGARRLADAQNQLDQTAASFVDGVNAVQAQGRDLDGNPGAALFSAGADPSDISLALDDPRGIAAAAPGGGTRDNSNLATLSALRTSGNFEGAVTDMVSTNAAALASKQTIAQAQGSIHDNAIAARDNVSGVSIDSEAVDLLRFQQAYSASSRVIQAARDIFQSILDIR